MLQRTLALGLVLFAVPGAAQVPTLVPRARLRVETSFLQSPLKGTLVMQTGDSLIVMAFGSMRTSIPSGTVSQVKTSKGKSHSTGAVRGLKVGGVTGALIGLWPLILIGEGSEAGAYAVAYSFIGAISGAAAGGVIGGAIGAEKWETVYSRPARVSFGAPSVGSPGLGLSIRF